MQLKSIRKTALLIFLVFVLLIITTNNIYAAGCSAGSIQKDFTCLTDVYSNFLNNAMYGAAILFLIMIISGGIKWLTSSGDPKDIENARGRMTYAVFGLLIMIISWFIIKFINEFSNISVIQFTIPK